jgi:shikimate dehydrogenase
MNDNKRQRPARRTKASDVDDRRRRGQRPPREIGGPKGLEPTRYGDWERKGRCVDF